MDEYTDLKEYIAALTRGKLLMCNVCRIEFPPSEAEFRTHMIGDMENFAIVKFVKKGSQYTKRDVQMTREFYFNFHHLLCLYRKQIKILQMQ